MAVGQRGMLPKDLLRAQSRFQAWREQRKPGDRIPQPLWTVAVRLASTHGVCRTAAALGLDYYSLKKRSQEVADPPRVTGPAFVELPAPIVVGKQCLLELDNGAGVSMRVQLMGYDAVDVEVLTRHFWNAK
jgi:hypothetical protein